MNIEQNYLDHTKRYRKPNIYALATYPHPSHRLGF